MPLGDTPATAALVPLGDLPLVGAPLPPAALADGAPLVNALATVWAAGDGLRHSMRSPSASDPASGPPSLGYITWAWGRDALSGSVGPATLWRVRFETTRQGTTYAIDGPFFDARLGHLPVRATRGAGVDRDANAPRPECSVDDVYEALIADPRAYLADVRVLKDGYEARVAGTLHDAGVPLHGALVGTDVDGVAVERSEFATGGATTARYLVACARAPCSCWARTG